MARTTILLEDDLFLEVKQLARANGTTATEIIRDALRAYVGKQRQSRLPSFTGIGKSRRRSVSQRAEQVLRRKINRREGW